MGKLTARVSLSFLAISLIVLLSAQLAAQATTASQVEIASIADLPSAPEVSPIVNATPAPIQPAAAAGFIAVRPGQSENPHHFWDRENTLLFAANGAMAGADFYVTHQNLARGGRELNPMTRILAGSTPALAANFALETGGVVGISYLLHKTGHHKLERATSMLNIGASAGAVGFGLAHR